MSAGVVNEYLEAIVRVVVSGEGGRQETVDALLDTGFNRFLTLPPPLVDSLGLALDCSR